MCLGVLGLVWRDFSVCCGFVYVGVGLCNRCVICARVCLVVLGVVGGLAVCAMRSVVYTWCDL